MLNKKDFVKFKNQSFHSNLKNLAHSSTNPFDYKMVFFGGTGAVGGQAVIECIEAFNFLKNTAQSAHQGNPELIITGITSDQIHQFCDKLFLIFGKANFELVNDNIQLPIYSYKNQVTLRFMTLMASPKFQTDLAEALESYTTKQDKIDFLISQASQTTSPFEAFIEKLKTTLDLDSSYRFQAVFSGIPVPSVATYHFEAIDILLDKHGLADAEKEIERSIKIEILKGLAQDFGDIKQKHAEEVLMAHTTSVGGMYEIIDGEPTIKLGYAHSSLGNLLKEKQFYANQLTIQYSNFNLKSLVTASAIGIDYIYDTTPLPLSSGVSRKFRASEKENQLPFNTSALASDKTTRLVNKVFPYFTIDPKSSSSETINIQATDIKDFDVRYALRSGENGLFSLDNAYSLYLNMKIASQEELAHVLVNGAFFGDDEQKPWFDENGICYYTQTDNSSLVFALLNNRKEFRRHQTSAFTTKAFQELGSSKHQAELHMHGLFILLHKLKNLPFEEILENIESPSSHSSVERAVERYSKRLFIEDVVSYGKDPENTANSFANLLSIETASDLAKFCGTELIDGKSNEFFNSLLASTKTTIQRITSLGTPIVYRKDGVNKIICGPYFAPLDLVITNEDSLANKLDKVAIDNNLQKDDLIEYLICNNGFVDLRPNATVNRAAVYRNGLEGSIQKYDSFNEFKTAINQIKQENGKHLGGNLPFSTSGILAYCSRINGLFEQLEEFDLRLGTFNGWKALFPIDGDGNHVLIPGLVEAMRHYSEGLGKITGTEFLYPGYGYFK